MAADIPELEIRAGEFFTFVGPSGCGKSTTLNMIAGLEEPSGGTLQLGERVLNDLPPHRRDIAFVFQTYALYPHRTVAENLAFPLELARAPRVEIRKRVQETAEMLGLTRLLEKRPRQLSGGERQRVALGRAIIRKPQLFLFDEPLSNLDAVLRAQMRKELKRLHQQLGTTFIYVTHDQEEALSLSDRIAILRDGRIQQCGSPGELYDRPANVFVASFFGSPPMNLLEGRISFEANEAWALVASRRIRVGRAQPRGIRATMQHGEVEEGDDRIVVGIRPEHIRLSCEAEDGAQAGKPVPPEGWAMRVTLVEPHGGQTHVELEGDGLRLTAVGGPDSKPQVGDTVHAVIPSERMHVFVARTGVRWPRKQENRRD
ncbi:MAG: ABC transporter ATP-binding protein [Candidatus Acidiferrales bacterium]